MALSIVALADKRTNLFFNEITERNSRVIQIANSAGTRSDRGASRDSGHRMQSEKLELLLPLRGDATLERTSDVDAPVSCLN